MSMILDDWWEILIFGLICLVALILVIGALRAMVRAIIVYLQKGGKLKAGPIEAGEGPAMTSAQCAPIEEHTALLTDLRIGQVRILEMLERITFRVNSTDESQGALIQQAAIMNKFVKRNLGRCDGPDDEINGDLTEADEEIRRARKIYDKGRRI